MIWCENE